MIRLLVSICKAVSYCINGIFDRSFMPIPMLHCRSTDIYTNLQICVFVILMSF